MGTAFWILAVVGALLALLIIAGLIGAAGQKTATTPVDNSEAVKNYYVQLKGLNSTVSNAYLEAATKAAKGDVNGAYSDFKGVDGQKIKGAIMLTYELQGNVPDVSGKQLLIDATQKFLLSFNKRQDAVNFFVEGIEENNTGKFLEAKAASEKADAYLIEANTSLQEIADKYGFEK